MPRGAFASTQSGLNCGCAEAGLGRVFTYLISEKIHMESKSESHGSIATLNNTKKRMFDTIAKSLRGYLTFSSLVQIESFRAKSAPVESAEGESNAYQQDRASRSRGCSPRVREGRTVIGYDRLNKADVSSSHTQLRKMAKRRFRARSTEEVTAKLSESWPSTQQEVQIMCYEVGGISLNASSARA